MSRAPQGPHLTMGLIDTAESYAGVMGKLIGEGKIRGWGQSQAAEDEVRRAHAVTPITAIQSEYSMMERMFEKDVLPACRELGIGFVPFSPLGAGFQERDARFIRMEKALGKQDAAEPMDFIAALAKLQEQCGVDGLKMSDYGIRPDEFMTLARNARATMGGLFDCDRVPLSDEECAAIFEKSYR